MEMKRLKVNLIESLVLQKDTGKLSGVLADFHIVTKPWVERVPLKKLSIFRVAKLIINEDTCG
jgi:hypothetical protein